MKLQLGEPIDETLTNSNEFINNNGAMVYIVLFGLFMVCLLGVFLPEALLFVLLIVIIWAIAQIWFIIIGTINVIISIFVSIGEAIKFFVRIVVFIIENIRYFIAAIIVALLLFLGCYMDVEINASHESHEQSRTKNSVWQFN